MHGEMSFPPRAESVRLARNFISRELTGAGIGDVTFTAMLLVSELVTNAVLHARTPFVVTLDVDGDAIRIAVHDRSDRPVQRRAHSVESGTGRGLVLVDTMAASWGVDPDDGGKAVWFELGPEEAVGPGGEPDLDAFLTGADLAQEEA